MKFNIITLGCKVNQYESQAMHKRLVDYGFTPCLESEAADIVIVNSCTVTGTSDQKVRQLLRRAQRKNPDAVMVLTGCMPQAFPDVAEKFENADVILGNSNRAELIPSIMRYLSSGQREINIKPYGNKDTFEKMEVDSFYERTRAFIKIEDGCNRFCSYCIIPYARGRVRSKPLDELREEVINLSRNGFTEIVLVGINLSAYGQDIGKELCDAVDVCCEVEGIKRVRLGSLEPDLITEQVMKRLKAQAKFCPQFHLSLQSGCDETLKRMNRHYTSAEYKTLVEELRSNFKDVAITTDVMVGFAGEDEEEFVKSIDFVERIGFAKVHVFAYSQRMGTKAADAPNQVNRKIKDERCAKMINITLKSRDDFLQTQVGREFSVLFETQGKNDTYYGYTPNYTPIMVKSDENLCGKIFDVLIEKQSEGVCIGTLKKASN